MIRLILALFALALTTSADAQQRTGTRIDGTPSRSRSIDTEAARLALYEFGRCMVGTDPRAMRASRALALSASSPEYPGNLRALTVNDCGSPGRMRLSELVMRGALFEALLTLRYGDYQPTDLSAVPEMDYMAMHPGALRRDTSRILGLNLFADCVFRAAPVYARGLMTVIPGTTRETEYFAALRPHLANCVPSGTSIQFSRTVLRNALAEVIYHYAQSAAQRAEEEAAR